jgi:hypothetical protein
MSLTLRAQEVPEWRYHVHALGSFRGWCKKGHASSLLTKEQERQMPSRTDDFEGIGQATKLVCDLLQIDQSDEQSRKRVTFLVSDYVRSGISDLDLLTNYVVYDYRRTASANEYGQAQQTPTEF